MSRDVLDHNAPRADAGPASGAISAAALAGALSSAAFVAGFVFFPAQSFREGMLTPYSIVNNVVTTLAFAALAAAVPTLRRVLDVPRWALYMSSAAFAGVAAMSWSLATLAPDMAKFVTDSEFDQFTAYLILFPLPKMILGLVGFTALGVSGWRRRAIPRGAAALLIMAGIASLWWAYPPGALLGALAFAWIVKAIEAGHRGPNAAPAGRTSVSAPMRAGGTAADARSHGPASTQESTMSINHRPEETTAERAPRFPRQLSGISFALLALPALLVCAVATTAQAQQVEQGRFDDQNTFMLDDFCGGLQVRGDLHDQGSYVDRTSGPSRLERYTVNHHGGGTFTNVATGKAFALKWNYLEQDVTVTDNGDGTLTVLSQIPGPETWYGPDGSRVLVNGGTMRLETVWDQAGTPNDRSDDTFVSEEVVSSVGGKPQDVDLCEAFRALTT